MKSSQKGSHEAALRIIHDPYDGSEVGRVHYQSLYEATAAIDRAAEAFHTSRESTSGERSRLLRRIADSIHARNEEFAQLITRESGKPIDYSRGEVTRAVVTFTAASHAAARASVGEVLDLSIASAGAGVRASYRYFPLGVIYAITPFNFPLNLVAHKVAPAIAAGNTVVLKPAAQTPLTSELLLDVMRSAGASEQLLQIVHCDNEVAQAMLDHPAVRMLSFTGSALVGWRLKQLAKRARVTLELGGNGMMIVDEIEDEVALVNEIVIATFGYAGQVCIGLQNLLIGRHYYERLLSKIVEASQQLQLGDPKQQGSVCGPIISAQATDVIEKKIADAIGSGSTRLTGKRVGDNQISPTVMTNVSRDSELWAEEIFGPVLNVAPYDTFEDALDVVNESRYGLQISVYTNDSRKIDQAYHRLEVGGVIVNRPLTFRVDTMPYGGAKDSGFGLEGVEYAMREMSQLRLLVVG